MKPSRVLARRRRLSAKRGYSLMEIMIVVAIMGLLVTLVGPRVMKLFAGAQSNAALTQMKSLKEALDHMQLDIGRYPTEQEGLGLLMQAPGDGATGWNGPYLNSSALPLDPWKQPYHYLAPQGDEAPKVMSYGKDNKEGGSGDNADLVV